MVKSLIPKSKAKTAYGLLSEIRALILEEPKRYNQGTTLEVNRRGRRAPACGTIGCVAGWTVFLKTDWRDSFGVMSRARDVLGLDEEQADVLFDAAGAGGYSQTLAHAEYGAVHIAEFQKRHAKQLKAKRV